MKSRFYVPLALTGLTAQPALAFDFGFVRTPDWMDPYCAVAFAVTLVFGLLTAVAKPRALPMNELYCNVGALSPVARLFYFAFALGFICLMALVFTGMGLQRAAEAGL